MSDLLDDKGYIVAGAFALLFLLEHIRPAAQSPIPPFRRIVKNLSFWPINIGLSLTVILPVSYFAAQNPLWSRPEWFSGLPALLVDVVLLDLFIFWWHRATHEIPLLWRFHEVHHLDQHLDSTTAIRFHFGEIFFSVFARSGVVILLAVPFESVIIFEILLLVFSLFHHSNIALPHRLEARLSRLIITPKIHWVHHHALQRDTDSNYGTLFSFWDRIFGTQSPTARTPTMKIGVAGRQDKGFVALLLAPFLRR